METLLRDVRFAIRSLVRRPAFATIAVATLAIGLGANAAVFSVIDTVLLRPLPYIEPETLVQVWRAREDNPAARGSMSLPDIDDIAALPGFETLVGVAESNLALTGLDQAQNIPTARVTDGLLRTFGLTPAIGRDITPADGVPGAAPVVVVAHGFWQTVLGGRPDILGSTIELGGQQREIVGVAPPGFEYPSGTRVWVPWTRVEGCRRGCNALRSIGRLQSGTNVSTAQAQLTALAQRLASAYPAIHRDTRFRVVTLTDAIVGDVRSGLWITFGAVTILLLIACANIAHLLLTRAADRRQEFAIRVALGAGSGHLVRQVVAEVLILALAGATCATIVAAGILDGLRLLAVDQLPRVEALRLDGRTILFTLALSLILALSLGLAVALRLARRSARATVDLRPGSASRGPREGRYRASLLASEAALSVFLLFGAALLLRTFVALMAVPLGFDGRGVVRFTLTLPYSRYAGGEQIARFFSELESRIGALPGVEAVGSVLGAPFARGSVTAFVTIEGEPRPDPRDRTDADIRPVTHGYFATMRIPVLRGRGIESTDRIESPSVAVVNEAFVREFLSGTENPLGKRVTPGIDLGLGIRAYEIVGVVRDVRTADLTAPPRPALYLPATQAGANSLTVHVRAIGAPMQLVPRLRAEVAALDPDLPLTSVETVDGAVMRTIAPTRLYLASIGGFALVALILAAVGVYGVVSYHVALRRREIGVRIALGAGPGAVLRMVAREGMRPVGAGLVLGLGAALAAGRLLQSLLFEVRSWDPLALLLAPGVLFCVAMLASLLPAHRATRLDAMTTMRAE
jgi:predicted permease